MTLAEQHAIPARVTAAFIFAGFVFSLTVNLPGHLSYDSVVQLTEARAAAYSGWHPPAMSWLLGVLDGILPGAALFVLLNTLFIYGSLILLLRLTAAPRWAAAVLAALMVLTPQYMNYPGIVWKDVLFASCSVMGFAALAAADHIWERRVQRALWLVFALVLLTMTALARQNGIMMLLAGAAAFGWIAARHETFTARSLALNGGAALLALLIALTASNVALGTRLVQESGAARQFKLLQLYDTIGMLAADPDMKLDRIDAADPLLANAIRSEGLRLYTPQRNDPLAAAQGLQNAALEAPPGLIRSQWLSLIMHRPLLYLETRADIFHWVFLTPRIDVCLPTYAGVSGPDAQMDDLNINSRWDARDFWLERYGDHFFGTPILQHGIFALLALVAAVLLFWRRRAGDIAIAFLQVGALAFTATFFFISIACDYRYLYCLDIAAMTAWFAIALDWTWWWKRALRFRNDVRS